MRKFEHRPPFRASATPAKATPTYVVRAAVIEQDAWNQLPRMPDEPSDSAEVGAEVSSVYPLPPEPESFESMQPRAAFVPPQPTHEVHAPAAPSSTGVRERSDASDQDLRVSPDDRLTPVAQQISHAGRASTVISEARALLAAGQHKEALASLEDYLAGDPEHESCHAMLLVTSIALRFRSRVARHADWLLARFVRNDVALGVCDVYARVVSARIDLVWKEAQLIAIVGAASRASQGAIVIDATNRLLRAYPESFGLPQALFAAAEHQLAVGREDQALRTLAHIVAEYPMSELAFKAQRVLRSRRK